MYCVSFCNVTGRTAITEQCYACLDFGIWHCPEGLAKFAGIVPFHLSLYVQNIGERFVRETRPHIPYQILSVVTLAIWDVIVLQL